jgi:hypothetical protein
MTRLGRTTDVGGAAPGWNRYMDSFDTAYLVAAPIAELVLIIATAIAQLFAH